jgi:hypothetical protein
MLSPKSVIWIYEVQFLTDPWICVRMGGWEMVSLVILALGKHATDAID